MTGDEDICGIRWCDEVARHDGPHRKRLLDTFGLNVENGRPVIFQLWLQGESARAVAPVLVTDARETGLTWSQASRLTNVLAGASGRFGEPR